MTIRTRFAPSPTGYLHIGGVRTALFNWLFTRRHGGQFILRIDDTDAQRNRNEALKPILEGFEWLGIDWDEGPTPDGTDSFGPHGPYFQSQRNELYKAAAIKLIANGHAYPDYSTKEQIDAMRVEQAMTAFRIKKPGAAPDDIEKERKAALSGQRPFVFRGQYRNDDPADNLKRYEENPTAIRLKVPGGRTIVVTDEIRGRSKVGDEIKPGQVEFMSDLIGDPVIFRAPDENGEARPLYNFATVVDDAAMKITHVIRAAEHLSNTPVQVLIFEALGEPVPAFAHVPVVNAPKSKEKLSKRKMAKFMTPEVVAKLRAVHAVPQDWTDEQIAANELLNPVTVEFYKATGYLPQAVVNYLGRLGWSLDDSSEFIPLPEMIAHFGLDRVNDSPASFDPDKLFWLAGEYMKQLPIAEKVEGGLPFLRQAGLISDPVDVESRDKLQTILTAAAERIKLFSDTITYAAPFLQPLPDYDPKAVADKLAKPGVAERLKAFAGQLAKLDSFDPDQLKNVIQEFTTEHQIKIRDLDGPLRVAVTGVTVGFSLPDILAVLGRDAVLARIEHALSLTQS